MIRPEFRKILLDQRGAAVILWSCFVVAIPLYIVIARGVLADPDIGADRSFAQIARAIVWLLTFVDLGYYFFWRRRNLSAGAILRDAGENKLFRALQDFRGPLERHGAQVISTYVTRKVVLFAIIEAIAVYGLIAALLGRYLSDQYVLSAVSLALLVIEFPYESTLLEWIRKVEQGPPAPG